MEIKKGKYGRTYGYPDVKNKIYDGRVEVVKNKTNEKVREIVNKWFKNQMQYTQMDELKGYIVTNNQARKLKRELWKFIEKNGN